MYVNITLSINSKLEFDVFKKNIGKIKTKKSWNFLSPNSWKIWKNQKNIDFTQNVC